MKRSLILLQIIILLASTGLINPAPVKAQAPLWQWATTGGGTYINRSLSGNICAVGSYWDPFIFIAQMYYGIYSPSGSVLHSGYVGSTDNSYGNRIAGDQSGNYFITGSFTGSITFGIYTLTNSGYYIVKYDSSGTVVWANEVTNGSANSMAMAADSNGHVFVAGTCNPGTTFGGTTLTSGGLFRVEYDSLGAVVDARSYMPQGYSITIEHMSFDNEKNLCVAGHIADPSGYIVVGLSATGPGLFILKMDASMNGLWVQGIQTLNSTLSSYTGDVNTDEEGNITLSGFSAARLLAGTDTLLSASGTIRYQMFVAQFDSMGVFRWAHDLACPGNVQATGITSDHSGNVFITGAFDSTSVTIGTTTLHNQINQSNSIDGFVAKYDSSGSFQWAKKIGGTGNDYPTTVVTGDSNSVYVSGTFSSTSLAFTTAGGNITLSNPMSGDITTFLAELTDAGSVGVQELDQSISSSIQIFPNPVHSNLSIRVGDQFKNGNLILCNSLGEQLFRQQLNGTECDLHCAGLAEGIYILTIYNQGKIESKKLIIQ